LIGKTKVYKPFVGNILIGAVSRAYIIIGLLLLLGSVFATPGTAIRSLPNEYTALVPIDVFIYMSPLGGTSVWGIEETVPTNWSISNVNCKLISDGNPCSAVDYIITTTGIEWVAIGAQTSVQDYDVNLSYKVTPPFGTVGDAAFSGYAIDYTGPTYNEFNVTGATVLNSPPIINFTTSGTTFTAVATIDLNAIASDLGGAVNRVEFYNGTTLLNTDTIPPYGFTWTNVNGGIYTLKARAWDDKNTYTDSIPIIITVSPDTILPVVSITNPLNNAILNGVVSITADATDNSGVVGVQFKVDGKNIGVEDLTNPYSVDWNTNKVVNGAHLLTAIARDAAGNSKTSAVINITVTGGLTLHPYDIDKDSNIDNNEFSIIKNCWKNPASCDGNHPDFRYYVNAAYLNTVKIWSTIYGFFYHTVFGVLCPPNKPNMCWVLGN